MILYKVRYFCFRAALLLFVTIQLNAQTSARMIVDKESVPKVGITDKELLRFFLDEFMILEENVLSMEIIDATNNGFGKDDLIKVFPSDKIYFIPPSDTAQKIMNEWKFTVNYQIVTGYDPDAEYENLPTDGVEGEAIKAIFVSLVKGIHDNYQDMPIKLSLVRDALGVTNFEIWSISEDKLHYTAPPPAAPDTLIAHDVIHVIQSDTLIIQDTHFPDFLYIVKTVEDSVLSDSDFKQ